MTTTKLTKAEELLRNILERFPQADPESEFYNDLIDGGDAVEFLGEIIPEIRKMLDCREMLENEAVGALKSAWGFIDDVTDDDPERNDKFFALREKVRNVLWR